MNNEPRLSAGTRLTWWKDEKIMGRKEVKTSCRATSPPVIHNCWFNSWLLTSSLYSQFSAPLLSLSVLFTFNLNLFALCHFIPLEFEHVLRRFPKCRYIRERLPSFFSWLLLQTKVMSTSSQHWHRCSLTKAFYHFQIWLGKVTPQNNYYLSMKIILTQGLLTRLFESFQLHLKLFTSVQSFLYVLCSKHAFLPCQYTNLH